MRPDIPVPTLKSPWPAKHAIQCLKASSMTFADIIIFRVNIDAQSRWHSSASRFLMLTRSHTTEDITANLSHVRKTNLKTRARLLIILTNYIPARRGRWTQISPCNRSDTALTVYVLPKKTLIRKCGYGGYTNILFLQSQRLPTQSCVMCSVRILTRTSITTRQWGREPVGLRNVVSRTSNKDSRRVFQVNHEALCTKNLAERRHHRTSYWHEAHSKKLQAKKTQSVDKIN